MFEKNARTPLLAQAFSSLPLNLSCIIVSDREGCTMQFSMTEHGFEGDLPFGKIAISAKDGHGFRPYQLLVSSIAVCSGGVLRNILEKMRMPASQISIDVQEVYRNEAEANRIEKVHLHFTLEGNAIQAEKLPRVFELVQTNCSMIQSVSQSIEVIETYEVM